MQCNYRVLDLFCGAGGFSTGFRRAGFTVVAGIDNDPAIRRTYEHNHPTEFILSDVRDLTPADFRNVDIVIGSPPCPDFSVGNSRKNIDRGMELVKLFREWIKVIQPKWWILENVPPLKQYLGKEYPKKVILNAADYGAPQMRERCFAGQFLVPRPTHAQRPTATLDGGTLRRWVTVSEAIGIGNDAHPLIITDQRGTQAMHGNSPFYNASRRPSRTITTVPQRVILAPEELMQRMVAQYPALEVIRPHTILRILRALGWMNALELDHQNTRPLSVRECAQLQTFPEEFQFFGTRRDQYRMIGNAVPPLIAQQIANAIPRDSVQ